MTITVQSVRDVPANAVRYALQADGSVLVYLPGDPLPPPPPPGPAPVPESVTKRQLYRGLMQVGWLGTTMPQINAAVDSMLAQMTNPPREVARAEFYTSRDYLRSNPLLLSALMSPPLSKTVAEIDDFFRLCATFAPEGSP